MQNFWERDEVIGGQPRGVQPLIPARPRQPAPKSPAEIEAERLENERRRQVLAQGNVAPIEDTEDDEDRRRQRITSIRTEFQGLPTVREFNATRDSFQQIQRLATSVPDNDPRRSQSDLALTYSFIKALDPGGRVTDQETQMIEGSAGLPQQARIALQRLNSGQSLTPEMRLGMVRAAYDAYMTRARSYNEVARQYQPYFRGLGEDPNNHIRIALGPDREREILQQRQQDRGQFQFNDQASELPQRGDPEFASALQQGIASGQLNSVDAIRRFGLSRGYEVNEMQAREALEHLRRGGGVSMPQFQGMTEPERLAGVTDEISGRAGVSDLLAQGATLGLSDEARGVGGAIHNILTAPFSLERDFDPAGSYRNSRDAERIRLNEARQRLGRGGTALEIAGGFASGRPTLGGLGAGPGGRTLWDVPRVPQTLPGRMGQGAAQGAGAGGVAGFGYGEGGPDSIRNAFIGAGGGAAIGALLPAAIAGGQGAVNMGRTLAGRNPSLAPQTIARAIEADGNTPIGVGRQMQEAQANGVPYMLADSGDNTRGLLAASVRAPGTGRTLARDALEQRQGGLADRVAAAVERDLGPAANPHQIREELIARAQQEAAPLYERAYARPGADRFASQVSKMMRSRPALRQAMSRAQQIAAEEGRDPTSLGFDINEAGEVIGIRVPSWQTMDYVKRGLDDVLQAQPRDPRTGRLQLSEGTRAIEGTRQQFLAMFDRANPEYAAARAAWAGPARARDAMDLGLRSLDMTADDLVARTRDLGPSEMEMLRLGVRRAMVERIASRGDSADVVNSLIGTGKKRAMLQRLFGGRREFDRFVATLRAEQEGFQTMRRGLQGSPTAQNLQDDGALNSAVTTGLIDMATTGLPITTMIRRGVDGAAARAGDQGREQIAALLSETDPTRLRELARELMREAARRQSARRAAGKRSSGYGRAAGQIAGQTAGFIGD